MVEPCILSRQANATTRETPVLPPPHEDGGKIRFRENRYFYGALFWYCCGFFLTLFLNSLRSTASFDQIPITELLTAHGLFVIAILVGSITLLCASVAKDRQRLLALILLTALLVYCKPISLFLFDSRAYAFQTPPLLLWGYLPLAALIGVFFSGSLFMSIPNGLMSRKLPSSRHLREMPVSKNHRQNRLAEATFYAALHFTCYGDSHALRQSQQYFLFSLLSN